MMRRSGGGGDAGSLIIRKRLSLATSKYS
jgi:hypothetical protein